MSEPPPLPDTPDPYELLGVAPTASALALKRAYLRLIRIYRPERQPRAFQRIHAAYEAVRHYAPLHEEYAADDEGGEDVEAAAVDPAPRAPGGLEARIADAWAAAAGGDVEAARTRLGTVRQDWPDSPVVEVHRLLLDSWAQPVSRPVTPGMQEARAALLDRGPEHGAALLAVFDPAELGSAVCRDATRWTVLRRGHARENARRLLRARWHRMLLDGRVPEILEEVGASGFRDDAEEDRELAELALEIAHVVAWRQPGTCDRLVAEFGRDATLGSSTHDTEDFIQYLRIQSLDQAYQRAARSVRIPGLLERWFVLWPVLDDAERRDLARRLVQAVRAEPGPYLAACDMFARIEPGLLERLEESLEMVGIPRGADVPLLQRHYLQDVMQDILQEIEDLRPAEVRALGQPRRATYLAKARPWFVTCVVKHALSPAHIAWWLRDSRYRTRTPTAFGALARHVLALDTDLGLRGLAALRRLAELDEITSHAMV